MYPCLKVSVEKESKLNAEAERVGCTQLPQLAAPHALVKFLLLLLPFAVKSLRCDNNLQLHLLLRQLHII